MRISRHNLQRFLGALLVAVVVSGLFPGLTAAEPGRPRPNLAPSSPFGLNTHLATRYPAPGYLSRPAERVTQLGVAWAREDFAWPRIEPRAGAWDWRLTDEMVAAHGERGVHILGRLGYSVGWATADQSDIAHDQSFAMPNIAAWQRYIRATVLRYRDDVHHWEIWNEPDNAVFWKGTPDPAAYARLLRSAYATIKATDPTATVLIGGLSPFDTRFLSGIARAGAWNAFDVLALHPFTDPIGPEQGQVAASGIGGVRGLLNKNGTKPIWITEVGWESAMSERNQGVDEQQQANYLVRSYMQLLAEPEVEKVFWYNFHDDLNASFGLVRFGNSYTDYSGLKASFRAYANMTRQLADATFVEKIDLASTQKVVEDWETTGGWEDLSTHGKMKSNTRHTYAGVRSGRIDYRFMTSGNDYVAFRPNTPLSLGDATGVGLWVYGNNSGHLVQIQLQDEAGEIVQFPLGKVAGQKWTWMQTSIRGLGAHGNRLGGGDEDGLLEGKVTVHAVVLDDQPNDARVQGTVLIDDLTAISGPDAYAYRWQRGNETIDVVYALEGATVRLPTTSTSATIVERDGITTQILSENGELKFWANGQPRYIHHTPPATLTPAVTTPPISASPTISPTVTTTVTTTVTPPITPTITVPTIYR